MIVSPGVRRHRLLEAETPLPTGRRSLRMLFTAVTVFLIIAAAYTSILIVQRQNTLQAVSRYNVTWLLSQAGVEVARLQAAAAATAIPASGVSIEDVQLWLDIVTNRIRLLNSGEVRDFFSVSSDLTEIVTNFEETIVAARPLVDHLDDPDNLRVLIARLTELNPRLARLAAAGNTASTELVLADLSQLGHLHWIFSAILAALMMCSASLIVILARNNQLLYRSHQKVRDLVVSLQSTSADLSDANQRAISAIEDAQLQNQILQARDRELNIQNARFDAALNNMSQALCMVDMNQRMIVCNTPFLELFGLSAGVVRPGTLVTDVFRAMAAIGRYDVELIEAIRDSQQALVSAHQAGRFLREIPDGPAIAVAHQPMIGGGWVATFEDMTERHRAEARVRFMAHYDALTRLPNRVLFRDCLENILRQPNQVNEQIAVLCLDLDYFKNVNDTLGHPAGDALLEAVSNRLRECVCDTDVVARLGGDEFAILQSSTDQPGRAEHLAKRIVAALAGPYDLDGNRAVVTASVGIAVTSTRDANADLLLKNADMALYRAKADGRNTYRFFAAEMDAQVQARRAMELELREALDRQEFEVFYQPIFDLAAQRVCGFEALLRWRHPALGMISPAQFIPLAEELGLIVAIGEWTLREACREAASWPDYIKVSVNLSPVQFCSDNLVAIVEQALRYGGLPPERLELEITETVLLQDNATVLAILHRLRALGLHTALDDFGTGYSSLSYLRSFPFDKLKIDQSFVREMLTRPDCRIIVNSIADLARRLGIVTTAEGVETAEQLALVREAGCCLVQGYFFDVARPASAIRRWLTPGPARAYAEIQSQIAINVEDAQPARDLASPAYLKWKGEERLEHPKGYASRSSSRFADRGVT
jgi:diguanylate cyclase (GGDEF)-like protein